MTDRISRSDVANRGEQEPWGLMNTSDIIRKFALLIIGAILSCKEKYYSR